VLQTRLIGRFCAFRAFSPVARWLESGSPCAVGGRSHRRDRGSRWVTCRYPPVFGHRARRTRGPCLVLARRPYAGDGVPVRSPVCTGNHIRRQRRLHVGGTTFYQPVREAANATASPCTDRHPAERTRPAREGKRRGSNA
jgi:hypothetical protein